MTHPVLCTGELPAGLRERRAGRPSGLPEESTLVGPERGGDHVTDAVIRLQWLRVPERIQYKLAVLAYKVIHGDAPRYLGPLTRVDDLPGRRTLRSTNAKPPRSTTRQTVNSRHSAAEPLQLRLHTSGIHCQLTSLRQARYPPSVDWLTFLQNVCLSSAPPIKSSFYKSKMADCRHAWQTRSASS